MKVTYISVRHLTEKLVVVHTKYRHNFKDYSTKFELNKVDVLRDGVASTLANYIDHKFYKGLKLLCAQHTLELLEAKKERSK